MSGYGWNSSSGYGNPNDLSSTPPTQEHCRVCQQVFYCTEALINHYETHVREEELMNFRAAIREINFPRQNNYIMRVHNQAPSQAQRSTAAFGPSQYQHLLPPIASLSSTHTLIQQRQMQPAVPFQRRQNLAALDNNANMVRPMPAARPMDAAVALAQNRPAEAIPDEIELDFRDGEHRSDYHHDGSINLDLTLGTP